MSGVALTAALVLTVANVARHHRPIELIVQLTVLAVIVMQIARTVSRHRALVPVRRASPTRPGNDGNGSPVRSHGR